MTTEDSNGTDDVGTDQANVVAEGESALGDAGKKALDSMKAQLKEAKAKAKAFEEELSKLKDSTTKDTEKPEDIRAQIMAEVQTGALRERALDRLEARAGKTFADPEDARAFLASKADEFISDGKVDNSAIDEALKGLLESKPHLSAAPARRFESGVDGGPRNEGGRPSQLTRADLDRMSKAGQHSEIVAARNAGRFDDLMKNRN